MSSSKKYWKSTEELNPSSVIAKKMSDNEFVEEIPVDEFLGDKDNLESSSATRRDFLKYVGFSTVAVSLAACEGPVNKTIPYVVQPEQIRPGVADYYATTFSDGFDFANILVKTREGRPIGISINRDAPAHSCPNSRVLASLLSLYDSLRLRSPVSSDGIPVNWNKLDSEVKNNIRESKAARKRVVLLTNTMSSPSTDELIRGFSDKFGGVDHVVYDAVSEESSLSAFEHRFGLRALADYDFGKADVIVSFDADFLGDWNGGGFENGYSKGRVPTKKGGMSKHFQFESNMTLTGANADKRIPLRPSQAKVALAKFYAYISGYSASGVLPQNVEEAILSAAKAFKKAGDRAVLVSGLSDRYAQRLVLDVNYSIGSKAFDYKRPILKRRGNKRAFLDLVKDMSEGNVGVLILSGVNPVYTLPDSFGFESALEKVAFSVAFSQKLDETSSKATYAAALSNGFESWGDVEMKAGYHSLVQPVIRKLFDTRQLQDALLKWSDSDESYLDYLRSFWKRDILTSGDSFNKALHDGFYEAETKHKFSYVDKPTDYSVLSGTSSSGDFEMVLYTKTGMGDGQQANNPWLQEFPDPITRVTWDNYVTISKADADRFGIKNWHVATGALDGNYIKITHGGITLKVPALIQPGQAEGTLGLSLGYGRKEGLKKEMRVGVNAYKLYDNFKREIVVSAVLDEGTHEFACIQLHNTLMGRGDIIKETDLSTFVREGKEVWNSKPEVSLNHKEVPADSVSIWDNFDRSIGHHFNLSIDLNACTGCGACVISCHAENNVPVVGKREMRRSRDMHWLRIDRYYSSEEEFSKDDHKKEHISGLSSSMREFGEMEHPSHNPQVAFQPVMCQQCNHAPCETVCPVAATSHGRQGQNHMAYNRCVGTRYCANNCPYKVRRFNWFLYNDNEEFDYHMNDDLGRMVLNPDVVVRSRGVMEKCSMCIQMTQRVILDAKRDGREIKDKDWDVACSDACSTGAMVFGDINDEKSRVSELKEDDRAYHLLEHVGTQPNVFYQVKVRNTTEQV